MGDAAKIRASDARQQKHDKHDARLLLQSLAENRFPRIRVPWGEQRDLGQLLDSSLTAGAHSRAGGERVAAPGDESTRAVRGWPWSVQARPED